MKPSSQYNFIICGAGCSGLSLVMHMIHSGKFSDKRVLLIDKDAKHANDRTWCFWQKDEGLFEPIVYSAWGKLMFHGENFSAQLDIGPYQYKMIRGIDFYEYCLKTIQRHSNIEMVFETVDSVFSEEKTGVIVKGQTIYADYVFNSILFEKPVLDKNEYWLLQHFRGWIIETAEHSFDENRATLMDFRIPQALGTAFCYVLPLHAKKALVEYTLFSTQLLEQDQYEDALRMYIRDFLKISSYTILEKEAGVIPMTNHLFRSHRNNIINIGTAGGQTKGSSGYTFHFIQKHSKAIVDELIATGEPFVPPSSKRFNFYDGVLLKVIEDGILQGRNIFTDLFEKNKASKIFKFLDNETTLAEELRIISTLPTLPFLKAGIKQMA